MCLLFGLICWPHVRGGSGIGCNPKLMLQLPWKVKVLVSQSCSTLWDPIDYSPPGSSVHGILQARTLERVAIPFSRGSSWSRDQTQVSHTAGRLDSLLSEPQGSTVVVDGSKTFLKLGQNTRGHSQMKESSTSQSIFPQGQGYVHHFCNRSLFPQWSTDTPWGETL